MKYRSFLSIIFAAVILALCVTAGVAQEVNATIANDPITERSTIKGILLLSIPEGLHVNSNKPSSEYLIATSVRFLGDGIRVEEVRYPEGRDRKFQFSDTELNIYEGEISIPFTIRISKAVRGKQVSMKAIVRYQACTDEVCYPPRKTEVLFTGKVR